MTAIESPELVRLYSEEFERLWEQFSHKRVTDEVAQAEVQATIDRNRRAQEKRKKTIAKKKGLKAINKVIAAETKEATAKMIADSMKNHHDQEEEILESKKKEAIQMAKEAMAKHISYTMKGEVEALNQLKEQKQELASNIAKVL